MNPGIFAIPTHFGPDSDLVVYYSFSEERVMLEGLRLADDIED